MSHVCRNNRLHVATLAAVQPGPSSRGSRQSWYAGPGALGLRLGLGLQWLGGLGGIVGGPGDPHGGCHAASCSGSALTAGLPLGWCQCSHCCWRGALIPGWGGTAGGFASMLGGSWGHRERIWPGVWGGGGTLWGGLMGRGDGPWEPCWPLGEVESSAAGPEGT